MDKLMLCLCFSLGAHGGGPKQPRDRLFGEDKFQHFFVSFIATGVAAGAARLAGADHRTSLYVGAGTGVAVGAVKEVLDARSPRDTASPLDLAWDVAGVGLATAVAAQAK